MTAWISITPLPPSFTVLPFPHCWLFIQLSLNWQFPSTNHVCLTKDFEHFFKWFSVIGESSVVNSRFSHTHHFWTGMFGFLVVIFLSSLYILDISPLLHMELVMVFSQSVGCWFVLLTMPCTLKKLSSQEVPFINSFFCCCWFLFVCLFCFCFFETGFLCIAPAVLELTL